MTIMDDHDDIYRYGRRKSDPIQLADPIHWHLAVKAVCSAAAVKAVKTAGAVAVVPVKAARGMAAAGATPYRPPACSSAAS